MKFLLGSNMKMSLIGVAGMNLWWWGDKNLVGWGESTGKFFLLKEWTNLWLVGGGMGGTPSPYPPAGKTLFIRYILVRKHNRNNA